jgi:hypothetical protein
MVAISEILLPASGDGRRRIHRSGAQAPRLNAALTRDPLQHIDGANAYQFVGSDPVGMADAERSGWWWPNLTPTVEPHQGGLQALGVFNAAVSPLEGFGRRPGETMTDCLKRALAEFDKGLAYAKEVYSEAVNAEANALYQEGVLQSVVQSEEHAAISAGTSAVTLVAAPAAEWVQENLFSVYGTPLANSILVGATAVNAGTNVALALSANGPSVPPQYLPERQLLDAMLGRLSKLLKKALLKCPCKGG